MAGQQHVVPELIGPYRILQLLGQGGMGAVYEAEETGPVRRRVALKVVTTGQDTREVVARFEAERQALALMNHPGIAKVFHAGTAESGAPYFTMELVRGLPITEFCDGHRLSIAKRIELFIAVCRAVQHAHQKGVIHRDLKPTNVLVTEQDGEAKPKIIDFGVAKAVGLQLTDNAAVTLSGLALGTAAYMSPEQADSVGVDIDTRADIYSLGVMLYELLVGELPLDPRGVAVHAFLARIASGQSSPQTPSARLSGAHNTGDVARARGTDPNHLRKELHGDLDWIVMKAMNPDRGLRYDSANGMAEDLERHLAQEPVIARPPSARYRFGKFVQRHRTGAIAAGLILTAIVAGGILATVGLVRARSAERLAASEAAAAEQVTAFLTTVFAYSDPRQARGTVLSAVDILERGEARVRDELRGEPALQARLLQTLGTVELQRGRYPQADSLLTDALHIRERQFGPNDSLVAQTLRSLGEVGRMSNQHAFADSVLRRSVAIRASVFGPESREFAASLSTLAALRYAQRKSAEAESLYLHVVAIDARFRSLDDSTSIRDRNGLAVVYESEQRFADADTILRDILARQQRTLPPDHPDIVTTLNNLGATNWGLSRYDMALKYYVQAMPIAEKVLGEMNRTTIGLENNIGEARWKLKQYTEAEALLADALAKKRTIFEKTDLRLATTLNSLAGVLRDDGKYRDAEARYIEALNIRKSAASPNPAELVATLKDYAELLRRMGRAGDAAKRDAEVAALTESKK